MQGESCLRLCINTEMTVSRVKQPAVWTCFTDSYYLVCSLNRRWTAEHFRPVPDEALVSHYRCHSCKCTSALLSSHRTSHLDSAGMSWDRVRHGGFGSTTNLNTSDSMRQTVKLHNAAQLTEGQWWVASHPHTTFTQETRVHQTSPLTTFFFFFS